MDRKEEKRREESVFEQYLIASSNTVVCELIDASAPYSNSSNMT
jgi:hypothetical protein